MDNSRVLPKSKSEANLDQNIYPGYPLHQIGPYIGKVRPSLARQLINLYSDAGNWIWDPFCGSGTIPLEGQLLSRNVIAADVNPYACALTRAKLHAPNSEKKALQQLYKAAKLLETGSLNVSKQMTPWVTDFFHERTLNETIALMTYFTNSRQYFLIGCLLGILHHQRPGFLSYPASHLVPYLRDKLYPRNEYPEAYQYRDPISRLESKIKRMLTYPPPRHDTKFAVIQKSFYCRYITEGAIDAVITSPPYMNTLDYARDNRLRLWFLDVEDYHNIKKKEVGKIKTFNKDILAALQMMARAIRPGGKCVLIFGNVSNRTKAYDVPTLVKEIVCKNIKELDFANEWTEIIPSSRRSRKNCSGTTKETIMVFHRVRGGIRA